MLIPVLIQVLIQVLTRAGWAGWAVLALLFAAPAPALAAELRVKVSDLRSNDGNVHFALYVTPKSFPKREGRYKGTHVPARALGALAVFTGLKAGRYALAVYHDENGNGEFDQGFLGVPLEGYAFSNGAAAFFGPPSFLEAAIELDGEITEITIPMTY